MLKYGMSHEFLISVRFIVAGGAVDPLAHAPIPSYCSTEELDAVELNILKDTEYMESAIWFTRDARFALIPLPALTVDHAWARKYCPGGSVVLNGTGIC